MTYDEHHGQRSRTVDALIRLPSESRRPKTGSNIILARSSDGRPTITPSITVGLLGSSRVFFMMSLSSVTNHDAPIATASEVWFQLY
jgi:hypothetical protein